MIEPTDEMRRAFLAEHDDACDQKGCGRPECLDVRLAAVLAVVERDYDVRPKFGPTGHPFLPHEDPAFGAFFGGGCGAEVNGVLCGWPRGAHREPS